MRIYGIVQDSIVDGESLRCAVFLQGCTIRCKGCHSPHLWDRDSPDASEVSADYIIDLIAKNPLCQGLTITGGEPISHIVEDNLIELCEGVKGLGKDIWLYTSHTYEDLCKSKDKPIQQLLELVDVIVDGRYIEELRDEKLQFRGSSNQRIVKLKRGN